MFDVAHYDYALPDDLIAQFPLANRTDARLMLVNRASQTIEHHHIRDLPSILRRGDLLVLNDTKVVPARLDGYRLSTRGHWSGLFVSMEGQGVWKVLGKTRGRLEAGESLMLRDRQLRDVCPLHLLARLDDGLWLARPESELPTWQLLEVVGRVPLPPYIRGGMMTDEDQERYQTVFASRPGAVAAPTAGLHFTKGLLEQLAKSGVDSIHVTLHVGIGTFRPMTVKRLADHEMHSEWGEIEGSAVGRMTKCRESGSRVIAVGTTVTRVLETAARDGKLQPWSGESRLFIQPPYEFQAIDGLLTNFHLPRSTLLVLVRTFGGDALMRRAYSQAIEQKYRFYSYGDAMLIL